MTLFEAMDESDADRDVSSMDISLVKKLTSKLPKIGARSRRLREAEKENNKNGFSAFSVLGSETSEASEASHAFRVGDEDSKAEFYRSPGGIDRNDRNGNEGNGNERNGRHSRNGNEGNGRKSRERNERSDRNEGRDIRDENVFSPGSGADSGGSYDRKKKKPLFQRMLEKAREEDRDHSRHRAEKPLYQRMLEKAQADSDRDEKAKLDEYKNTAAQKRMKLPKIVKPEKGSPKITRERDSSTPQINPDDRGHSRTPNGNPRQLEAIKVTPNHKISSRGPSPSIVAPSPSGDSLDGNPPERRRKVSKKPLFQRLLEKAQVEEEKAQRSKMDEYNLQRAKKRSSNAPSREEIKERVEQGIARNDGAQLAHREHRKEQEERDKERERERDKEREREKEAQRSAKKSKALDKSNRPDRTDRADQAVGPAMLTSQSTPLVSVKGPYIPHNCPHNSTSRSATKNKDHHNDQNRDNTRDQNRDNNRDPNRENTEQKSPNGTGLGSGQGSKNGSNNGSLNGSLNGLDEDDGYSGDDQGEGKGQKIGMKKLKALRGRASPRNKPGAHGAQGMKRIAEEEIELFSESESVSINPRTSPSTHESPSSSILTDFSHRENSITVFSPISQDTDTPFGLRKSKDSNGSGELTEKGSVKNKKSKRDKEKEKEDMINDFNFSFENTAEPSLIDDLDDSLLAKKNNKNNSLKNKVDASGGRVRFTGKEGSSHSGSKQDFSRDHPLLRDSQLRETHMSGLIGPQWVSEVLESDENELGLLMMYSEGFSMFMAEEEIILDAPAIGTVW